jgi:hypothetical protein
MYDAFKRALLVRENLGVYALTLHAFNETVEKIYADLGFKEFAVRDQDRGDFKAMFVPLSDVAASLAAAE